MSELINATTEGVSILNPELPSGAATATWQESSDGHLASIDAKTPTLVSGAVPVTLTGGGDATAANQVIGNTYLDEINDKLPTGLVVTGGKLQVELPAGGSGLTDSELRATPVPVSLSSTSISNFPSTQAVTGPLTDTQIRATALPISGAITSNAGTNLNTSALNLEATQSALNTKIPSGLTVTANRLQVELPSGVLGLTDAELRATPVPVSLSSTSISNFPATQPVSGTVTANLGTVGGLSTEATLSSLNAKVTAVDTGNVTIVSTSLPTGASTSALQTSGNSSLTSLDGKVPSGLTVTANRLQVELPSGGSGLTNTELRATPVPVSAASLPLPTGAASETTLSSLNSKVTAVNTGAVVISSALPTGTNSIGQVTANAGTNLNTSSLNLETTQSAINTKIPSGLTVTANRLQVELPSGGSGLTNTELRASAVPVSLTSTTITGSVAVTGPLTDAQLRASAVPVSGVDTTGSGTITANAQSVAIALNGKSGVALQITGTWVGTIQFEGTVNGTDWVAVNGVFAGQSTLGTTTTANGLIRLTPSGLAQLRATSTAWTSGTATLSLRASDATGGTFLNQSLTAGTNSIGTVQAPAVTKGTQGANGFTVQSLKDADRNARHFMLDAYTAAPLVEAVQTVVQWYGNVAVAGTTQPAVVPAGKTLRLISWQLTTKSLSTVGSAVVRVRANTAGLGVIGSPLVYSFEAGSRAGATTVAMTGGMGVASGNFPEGFELPAGTGLAFSMAGYGPTGALALQGVTRFAVYGYEY